jgi:hypothetical protein
VDTKDEKPFDPNELSDDVKKYLDQERTKASNTASANAKKKLMKDSEFIAAIKTQIETENSLTVEQKLANSMKDLETSKNQLAVRENRILVKETLTESGIDIRSIENVDVLIDVLSATDVEVSKNNATVFSKMIESITNAKVEKTKQDLLKGGYEVVTGDKGAVTLQDQYDKAKTSRNTMEMIRIKQEATSKGVQISGF